MGDRVLLCDDEPKTLVISKDILSLDGLDIDTAKDGREALEALFREGFGAYRAIVTDIRMPNLGGIDLLEKIREHNEDVPVIILTGYGTLDTAAKAVQRGAFDYLLKPIDFDLLKKTIRRAIDRGKLVEENRRLVEELKLSNAALEASRARLEAWSKALEDEVAARTRELASQRDLLENVIATMPTALAVLDGGLGVSSANGAYRRLFGAAAAERGARLPAVLAAGPVADELGRVLTTKGSIRDREVHARLEPPSGAGPGSGSRTGTGTGTGMGSGAAGLVGERVLRVAALALSGPEGRLLLLVDDVSEASRLEEELVQAEKLSSLGLLASGIVHDLNNPLAAILGSAQLLQAELEEKLPPPGFGQPEAQAIVSSALYMRQVIADLSQLSRRVRKGETSTFDVNDVIDKAVSISRYGRKLDDIEVVRRLQPDLPPIAGTATEVLQVFMNLIVNAGDAIAEAVAAAPTEAPWTQTDRPPATIELATRAAADGAEVTAEVRDNGPGIPGPIRERLFEPFFTTKGLGKGTGLGLYISKRIVKRLGGTIEVETAPGKGTVFRLKFPAAGRPPAST